MNIRRNEKADLARKKGGDERIRVGRDREERARAAKTHEEREERWMMDVFRARTHRRTKRRKSSMRERKSGEGDPTCDGDGNCQAPRAIPGGGEGVK